MHWRRRRRFSTGKRRATAGRTTKPWLRLYVTLPADLKVRSLSPTHRWLWVCVLIAARQSPLPGVLLIADAEPVSSQALADLAGMRVQDVRSGMAAMGRLGLVVTDGETGAWAVSRWSDRQFESDSSTARTRLHRSKERSGNVPGTASGTFRERARDREQKTETERTTLASGKPAAKGAAAQRPRKPDELWDALLDACGVDGSTLTKSARGAIHRAVAELRDVGATPDEIKARAARHKRKWPSATLTPPSLARHWAELVPLSTLRPPVPPSVPQEPSNDAPAAPMPESIREGIAGLSRRVRVNG